MTQPATVSVVMPVFNGAAFIGAALDAALAQTHRDTEIIVVDDGSSDETPAILARYGTRIRILRQPRGGISAARNAAIAVARGSLIALLDSDDEWLPTHLASAVARLAAAAPDVVGFCAGSVHIDRDGRILTGSEWCPQPRIGLRDLLPNNALRVSPMLLRHEAVLAVGGFDETTHGAEDWDMWIRLALAGGWFVGGDTITCRMRWHGGNLSSDPLLLCAAALGMLEKLFARGDLPADLQAQRERFVATVIAHAGWALYQLGRDQEADAELRRAAGVWPEILCDEDSLYAIICATSPLIERHDADTSVNLERGAARIRRALAVACAGGLVDPAIERRAQAAAARVLATLAIKEARVGAARRFVWQALRTDPTLWSDARTLMLLAQAFAGRRAVSAWQRNRSR